MLHINRNAEVALHGIASDIEFTFQRVEDGWRLTVENQFPGEEGIKEFYINTDEQAGAIMALFCAGDFTSETLNEALYNIATPALKDVPEGYRLIP